MSTLDALSISRLTTAFKWSTERLKPFREKYKMFVEHFAGPDYGDGGYGDKMPVNMLRLLVNSYHCKLSSQAPQCLVVARDKMFKTEAYEFRIALNNELKDMEFGESLKAAVKQALFCMGIMKVGITQDEGNNSGYLHDVGKTFADSVDFDDWTHDMNAKKPEEWTFCGDKYKLPKEFVLNDPSFDAAGRDYMANQESGDSDLPGGEGKAEDMSIGSTLREEFDETVELQDIWLPRRKLLVTFPGDMQGDPLKIIDWEGPENGPYHVLRFGVVPGNLMPSPPSQFLFCLHDLVNRLFVKISRQAENTKTIFTATGAAVSDGSVQRVIDAAHGEVVRVDHNDAVKEQKLGNVDQATFLFAMQMKEFFSYFAGNLDSMAGLGANADTWRQEKMMTEANTQLLAEMQDSVHGFVRPVCSDIGFYIYTDPLSSPHLEKQIGQNLKIPFDWGQDRRNADWKSFKVDIEPYSMIRRSPGERLNDIMQVIGQVMMPLMPLWQQQGGTIDLIKLVAIFSQYRDLPELEEILSVGGMGPTALGQQQEQRQAPVTTRNNVRTSVAAGPTRENATQQMMQQLMSGANAAAN